MTGTRDLMPMSLACVLITLGSRPFVSCRSQVWGFATQGRTPTAKGIPWSFGSETRALGFEQLQDVLVRSINPPSLFWDVL